MQKKKVVVDTSPPPAHILVCMHVKEHNNVG